MFDFGWSEMLVIVVVLIVVVGPKDLPQMLRTFGRMSAKMRGMANDFQKQFNEALKEAELEDVKKSVDSLRSLNPAAEIRKQLNPFEKAATDVKSSLADAGKPKATPVPETKPADPDAPFPAMTDGSVPPAQAAGLVAEPVKSPPKPAKAPVKAKAAKAGAGKASPARTAAAKAAPTKKASPAGKVPPKAAATAKAVEAAPAAAQPRRPRTARKTTRTPR